MRKRKILLDNNNREDTYEVIPADDHTCDDNLEQSQVYELSEARSDVLPSLAAIPISAGIARNVYADAIMRSVMFKWFRSLFSSTPFSLDNYVTTFQVYPDINSINSSGFICDQVIIYGQVPAGFVDEGNNVEVYGRRDARGNIIASSVINTASGTIVRPYLSLSAPAVKFITLMVIAVIAVLIAAFLL